jgi:meso-butanediol dehydrogenase/(S,S)-butanediol dehydrogenase/diacetyl reductase
MGTEFAGSTVVITGGASGIGRATAVRFAEEGAWVLVADVDEKNGQETLRLMKEANGKGDFITVDVSELDDLRRAVDFALSETNRLDVMFNNVGIPMAVRIDDITEEQWNKVINVNLKGMFFGCKLAIEQMLKQGGGAIVNTASDMGLVAGLPNQPAYIASKGGAVLLTKALAIDYARDNIRVNCVCPCVVETPMIDAFLYTQFDTDEERAATRQMLNDVQPIGRMCKADEVAEAVLFLASARASGITGVALPVDGGFVAK